METTVRDDFAAGIGWYRNKDGELRTGTRVPDARWLRLKKFEFIGNAEYGPGGSWVEPLQKLIRGAKMDGDPELAEYLEVQLRDTITNIRDAGKDHAQARADKEEGEMATKAMMDAVAKRSLEMVAPAQASAKK